METTCPLFLALVLLFSVSSVRATVDNSEDDFEENNQRVDAEQDPYTKVTLAPKSGDAVSTLFRSCLESSRTFDAKFASIETPGGITYIRYVPDSTMLAATPVTWENAVGRVSDIFECTSVAEAGGYSMFKYSASGCQLSKQEYDLGTVPVCDTNEEDAVFIKFVVPAAPCCKFPYTMVGGNCIDDGIVTIIQATMSQADARTECTKMGATLFSPENPGQIPLMTAYLQTIGCGACHWTAAWFDQSVWRWDYGAGRLIQGSEWAVAPSNNPTRQCACFDPNGGLGPTTCFNTFQPLCVKPATWCP